MAFDAHVGIFLEQDRAEYGDKVLQELNQNLAQEGLPLHQEPRTWDEILARHPHKKRKRQRDLGARLGFYSSPKYEDLRTIAAHLEILYKAPSEWPVNAPNSAPTKPLFEHLRAMLCMDAVLLPRELEAVLRSSLAQPREVSQIASAQRVQEEAELILAACGALDTEDPNQDWKNAALDERLASLGIKKVRLPDPWVTLGEPLDLCLRLIRVAEDVLWSGCFALTG